jgi:hypothetical protein
MRSVVAEFGSGFALLPRNFLDSELIESPFHRAKTHGSFVYSKESSLSGCTVVAHIVPRVFMAFAASTLTVFT